MIELNKIGLNQVQLNRLYLNTLSSEQRIRSGGGTGDGFPVLPGDVTRWHFGGLTNEMMAAMDNPRLEDADGKGRFLSFKNFAWSGMSGIGGYVENYNRWTKSAVRADITFTDHSFNVTSVKINQAQFYYQSSGGEQPFTVPSGTVIVKGLTDGQVLEYIYTDIEGRHVFTVKNDGIYTLPSFEFIAKGAYYGFQFNKVQESCNITIEQLPLYPGALVFDGVDDYGTCDNFPIPTKEKGYTVVALRQWINENTGQYFIVNRDSFIMETNLNNRWISTSFSNSNNFITLKQLPFVYQSTYSYNGETLNNVGSNNGSNVLTVCCNNYGIGSFSGYANVAIWELVFLDHDATEEELTKIKDYFVKTYPWLFPDQAWTVTGKTNEDEDRATIANITGNGNDLVLSNFGFVEGSGYNEEGEYAGYLVTDGVDDKVQSSSFTMNEDWTIVGDWELLSNVQINCGIVKAQNVYLYNTANGLLISINNPRSLQSFGTKSLHAICSDGRLYDRNWVEYEYTVDQNFEIVESSLNIGFNLNNYTQIAFKNLGIYNNQLLSKDDCIKAYNYLQTLKAK